MKRTALALILATGASILLLRALHVPEELVLTGDGLRLLLGAGVLGLCLWVTSIGLDRRKEGITGHSLLTVLGVASAGVVIAVSVQAPSTPLGEKELVRRFRQLYYNKQLFKNDYLGIRCLQYPTDQWVMQEIISDVRPDFIVETGTWSGATTLYYAHVLEHFKPDGKILTVDIEPHGRKAPLFPAWDERVEFLLGDSVSDEVVNQIAERVKGHRVLVTLDSSHATEHVARELERYAPMVSVGSYIVVQDTHLGGNPNNHPSVDNPGPLPAVLEFLAKNPNFTIDRDRERHLITQNPSGYLKRVR